MEYNEFPSGVKWPVGATDIDDIYSDPNVMRDFKRAMTYSYHDEMTSGDYTVQSDPFTRLRRSIGHRVFVLASGYTRDHSRDSTLLKGIRLTDGECDYRLVLEDADGETVCVPFDTVTHFIDEDTPPDARTQALMEHCLPDAKKAIDQCATLALPKWNEHETYERSPVDATTFFGELSHRLDDIYYKMRHMGDGFCSSDMTEYEHRFVGQALQAYIDQYVNIGDALCILERKSTERHLRCTIEGVVIEHDDQYGWLHIGIHVRSADDTTPRERVVWLEDVVDFLDDTEVKP